MAREQTLTFPDYAPDEIKAVWASWPRAFQEKWILENPPTRKKPTPVPPSMVPMEPPAPGTVMKTEDGKILPMYEEKPVTEWDRNMELDGKIVPAKRIRYAILELIARDDYYAKNMSNGYVKRMLSKILADSTPGWEPPSEDSLIIERVIDKDTKIREIGRDPRNDEERQRIRKRFGVNSVTIKRLSKKDCQKCGGTGYYRVSSYPGQGYLEKLSDTVTCECVFE